MLLIGLAEANSFLEEMQSDFRFKEDLSLGEYVYDLYTAKKKNGKPKDGDPSKLIYLLIARVAIDRITSLTAVL